MMHDDWERLPAARANLRRFAIGEDVKPETVGNGIIGSGVGTQVAIELAMRRTAERDFLPLLATNACGPVNEPVSRCLLDTLPSGGITVNADFALICGVSIRGGR